MQEHRARLAVLRAAKTTELTSAPVAYYLAWREIEKIQNASVRKAFAYDLGQKLVAYARAAIAYQFKGDYDTAVQDPNIKKLVPVILHQLCELSPDLADSVNFSKWSAKERTANDRIQ